MPRFVLQLCLVLIICATSAGSVLAQRVALVIGNSQYKNAPALQNPDRDARDIGNLLRTNGFEVIERHDLTQERFMSALGEFSERAAGAEWAVIYYAGHGLETQGVNYLLPVSAELSSVRRLPSEAISLETVLGSLDGVRGTRLVILDACRNNPFAGRLGGAPTRAVTVGLAEVEAPANTVIAYSARQGTVALDGTTGNSPFASALLESLATPGLELQFALRSVRDKVLEKTSGRQEPYISASLSSAPVYLAPGSRVFEVEGTPTQERSGAAAMIRDDWSTISESTNPAVFQAFIEKYQGGGPEEKMYSGLAAERLQKLKGELAAKPKETSASAGGTRGGSHEPSSPDSPVSAGSGDPKTTQKVTKPEKRQPEQRQTKSLSSKKALPKAPSRATDQKPSVQASKKKKTPTAATTSRALDGGRPDPIQAFKEAGGKANATANGARVQTKYGVVYCKGIGTGSGGQRGRGGGARRGGSAGKDSGCRYID